MSKLKSIDTNGMVYRWLQQSYQTWESWHSKAYVDRCYYEGAQWTTEEAAALKKSGQPVITVNHIWGKVNTMVGMLLQQRPTIRCLPRGKNDAELASVGTKVIRYVLEINKYRRVLSEVFTDVASVGIGWVDIQITNDLTKDPILLSYVPWDEMVIDPLSKQPDYSDARFVFRGKWVELDILKENYPKYKNELIKTKSSAVQFPGQKFNWYDAEREMVFVIEAQYKTYGERDCFWDGVSAVKYIPEIHKDVIQRGIGRLINARIPIVRKMIIGGGYILEDGELPYLFGDFSFIPFIAYRDKDGNPFGIVKQLKDMQDEINKRRSKVLHYLTAKRVLAEEGAVDDPDEFMDELVRPDAFLTYNKGYDVNIEQDLELGAQHFQLMQEAANEMSSISGIYPDFSGMPTNARNASAIRQRVMQSQTAIQKLYSVMEMGIQRMAEHVLALVRQYYREERLIQLTDEPEAFFINETVQLEDGTIQMRNNLVELRGDIVVSVEGGGATERQEQLAQLVEMIKVLPPQVVMYSMDILLDAFDIPQKADLKQRYLMMMQMMQQQQAQGGNPTEGNNK